MRLRAHLRRTSRYLRNEPVTARPPTPAYRFQKMIRRNRLAFAAAATVVAALLVGLILTFSQAKRARQAEQTIRRNAYVAQMSVAFQAFAQGDLGRARQLLNLQRPGPRQDDCVDSTGAICGRSAKAMNSAASMMKAPPWRPFRRMAK